MQSFCILENYLRLKREKKDIKNRAWGQSIPALSSRPVLDFHWQKLAACSLGVNEVTIQFS